MANFLDMNGTDADKGHSAGWDYEPHSPAECRDCGHYATVADFLPDEAQP